MSPSEDQPLSLLRRILKLFSLDWIAIILDLGTSIRRYLCIQPTGPYEILDYEVTVELRDTKGKDAIFRKRQRVKFLQNSVIAFEDYAWGDGDILSDYRCTPGVVVDKYKEGDRFNILVSLRDTKSVGDIEQFHIEQRVKNTYLKAEEWLQTEIRRHTRRLVMNVIFPKARHCKRAVIMKRSASKVVELEAKNFDTMPDGRQLVSWETEHTRPYEIYTLKWRW